MANQTDIAPGTPGVPQPASVEGRESGQAIVEAAIVLPAMVFLILTVMQLTMVQHARIMTEYAAYCAARAGIVFNADKDAMTQAATVALMPTMGRTDTPMAFAATALKVLGPGSSALSLERTRRRALGLDIVRVEILSPKPSDFTQPLTKHLNGKEIDFDDLRTIAAKPLQLQIEIKYFYQMSIPYANQMLQAIWMASRPGAYILNQWKGYDWSNPEIAGQNAQLLTDATFLGSSEQDAAAILANRAIGPPVGGYYMPLKATYTMRMQSNPFIGNL